jgi:hypothetical protein
MAASTVSSDERTICDTMQPLSLVVAGALALAASGATWKADHGNGNRSSTTSSPTPT